MEREPVESSNLASVGYEPATETLEVEFLNGSIYQYANVPRSMYEQLLQADSKGRFLNLYIKKDYPASRVG